jgi:peptide/nickel transport system permease protein
MIPARLKRWILIWTPLVWLCLTLITYPRDTGVNDGLYAMIKGFFAGSVADYAAWLPLTLAYIVLAIGVGLLLPESIKSKTIRKIDWWLLGIGIGAEMIIFLMHTQFFFRWVSFTVDTPAIVTLGFVAGIGIGLLLLPLQFPTRKAAATLPIMLVAMGVVCTLWTLSAAGVLGGDEAVSLRAHQSTIGWLFQTIVVLLAAAMVWVWGAANPERAELMVWNSRQVWKLYRANWQGMLGLYILVFFTALALLAPFIADHGKLSQIAQVGGPLDPPAWSYYKIFGTDEQGLSIWAEFVWSARISLAVGLIATVISSILGAAVGILAGYLGGGTSEVLMRLTDAFLVIPWLPLAMVLAAAWGRNYWMIIVIIGVTSWPGTARVVRADALRVRELQFIERARAIGSSSWHTMNKHILPNVFPLIFANTVLVVAVAILSETELSFLGLGDPLNFSWGSMLQLAWGAGAASLGIWWYILPPGIAIVLVVLAFTFIGTAFDEVLDPKLRKREDSGARPDEESRVAGHVEIPSGPVGGTGAPSGATGEGGLL